MINEIMSSYEGYNSYYDCEIMFVYIWHSQNKSKPAIEEVNKVRCITMATLRCKKVI